METRETTEDGKIVLFVSGEIDGTNVDDFEKTVGEVCDRTEHLVLDLQELDYVSSAGLRVFLIMQKKMKQRGHSIVLRNVNEEVMDIFGVTGFAKLLNFEEN